MIHDIRSLRQQYKIKQRDFANTLEISLNELMKIERGLTIPTEDFLLRVSKFLDVDVNLLKDSQLSIISESLTGEGYVTNQPQVIETVFRKHSFDQNKKPIIDLFCGVGGFSFGFEMSDSFQVVAGVDLLGDRLRTFSRNHTAANAYGQNIRTLRTEVLDEENPRPFAILGGPPCQGFSSIRPFRNIEKNDPRNNLAEEFCRIVKDLQPEWLIFENVVGLLTYNKGTTFKAILEAFQGIGYRVSARILNAAFYGLPQRRERLVIVGNIKGKPFKWPEPTHWCEHRSMAGNKTMIIQPEVSLFSSKLEPAITIDQAIHDLPQIESGQSVSRYNENISSTDYEVFIRNCAEELTLHEATAHSSKMIEIIKKAGANIFALPVGTVSSGFSSCYSRLNGNEPSVTLTVNFVHPASNRCIHPYQNRALTPREGARLQGFFDTFQFLGTRSQIVKQIGNAVPPLLGKVMAEAILESD